MPPVATPLSRTQSLWLAGVLTVAAGLRLVGIENLSLSHMDEGGYTASAMTVATGGPYSFPYSQALQSPPLLPWIIGSLVWLTQAQWPILGVFVSAAFGVASVLLLFLLARRWGGNPFGLWAATLLAISDFHVAYSRMVLTDVPLTFWFLLTLYCVTRLWEQVEAKTPEGNANHRDSIKKVRRQSIGAVENRNWMSPVGWGVAAGLAGGAAWNTKYNGWLVVAISIFSAGLWIIYRRLTEFPGDAKSRLPISRDGLFIGCLLLAGFVATACYVPWYLFVERQFDGGYAAVTANHRGYFYPPAAWPRHAHLVIGSLAALRHYGWVLAMGLVLGLGWRTVLLAKTSHRASRPLAGFALQVVFVMGLALVVLIQGGDALLLILGTVGIVPALHCGRWERVLAAVWCGTFVVLAPLYHPYPRLWLPALPACICLALWLLQDAWPGLMAQEMLETNVLYSASWNSGRPRLVAVGSLIVAGCISLIWLLGPHPFGLFAPTGGVWNRWTTHHSYREAGQAVLEHTDPDAVIICQTQLAMISYCERMPLTAEEQSFDTLLPRTPTERNCYLLVDYCWIHDKSQTGALQGLQNHARDLTPVAIVDNDLNIVTLLDQMTLEQVAAKLRGPQLEYSLGAHAHSLPAPPPLSGTYRDVIVLYRIRLPLSR